MIIISFNTVWATSTLSTLFENCPDSLKTVRTVLKWSRQFWKGPDGFERVRTVLKGSGRFWKGSRRFWKGPDGFERVWTVLKGSGRFSKGPDSFERVQKRITCFLISRDRCLGAFLACRKKCFRALRPVQKIARKKAAIRKKIGFCASAEFFILIIMMNHFYSQRKRWPCLWKRMGLLGLEWFAGGIRSSFGIFQPTHVTQIWEESWLNIYFNQHMWFRFVRNHGWIGRLFLSFNTLIEIPAVCYSSDLYNVIMQWIGKTKVALVNFHSI